MALNDGKGLPHRGPIWKTKDGREFIIKNMLTDHIKNCIKLLEKNKATDKSVYKHLNNELESRGEKIVKKTIKMKFKFIADKNN